MAQLGAKVFLSRMPDLKEERHSCSRDSYKQGDTRLKVIKERALYFIRYLNFLHIAPSQQLLLCLVKTNHLLVLNSPGASKEQGQAVNISVSDFLI